MKPSEIYIIKQPEPYRTILLHLQVLIEATLPEAELLFKWKIPCYYLHKRPICYLNVTKGYVDVGFWKAQYFTKCTEKLVKDKRKYIKSLRYVCVEEIEETVLITLLNQANEFKDKKFITN